MSSSCSHRGPGSDEESQRRRLAAEKAYLGRPPVTTAGEAPGLPSQLPSASSQSSRSSSHSRSSSRSASGSLRRLGSSLPSDFSSSAGAGDGDGDAVSTTQEEMIRGPNSGGPGRHPFGGDGDGGMVGSGRGGGEAEEEGGGEGHPRAAAAEMEEEPEPFDKYRLIGEVVLELPPAGAGPGAVGDAADWAAMQLDQVLASGSHGAVLRARLPRQRISASAVAALSQEGSPKAGLGLGSPTASGDAQPRGNGRSRSRSPFRTVEVGEDDGGGGLPPPEEAAAAGPVHVLHMPDPQPSPSGEPVSFHPAGTRGEVGGGEEERTEARTSQHSHRQQHQQQQRRRHRRQPLRSGDGGGGAGAVAVEVYSIADEDGRRGEGEGQDADIMASDGDIGRENGEGRVQEKRHLKPSDQRRGQRRGRPIV